MIEYTELIYLFEQPHEDKDIWVLRLTENKKEDLIETVRQSNKFQLKLKSMEISFELINNDRNSLIKQLAECELELEKKNGL